MNQAILYAQLQRTISDTNYTGLGTLYKGKVRDVYIQPDRLLLVVSDRISAFDHILRQTIPFKGQVLNQLAYFFFKATAGIINNHILSVPDPNVTIAQRCDPIPLEFVVRAYLAGHAWREYSAGKRVLCGKKLAGGLRQNSKLPEPILTPATKAKEGHDEDISRDEAISRGLISETEFDYIEQVALDLYRHGNEMAEQRGLLLVDTKYEFGKTIDGNILLIDEVHTPDSSRYFYADSYDLLLKQDKPQRQLSKEFVREWLMNQNFMGKAEQVLPDLPDDFRVEIANRYIELYESITGQTFIPDTHPEPIHRIKNVLAREAL